MPSIASTFTWSNASGGGWNVSTNWNPNGIPGVGDSVVVPDLSASATISLGSSVDIASFDSEGGGALAIGEGDTLTVTSAVSLPGTIIGGGVLEVQTQFTNTGSIVVDAGTLQLDDGLSGAGQISLVNGGVLDAGGGTLLVEIGAGNTVANGGVLEATGTGTLQIDGGTLDNTNGTLFANGGAINLTGGVIVAGGTLSSADGGVIQSTSGNSVTLDQLVNTGVYSVDNNSATQLVGSVSNQGAIYDDGSLQIGDAAGDGGALTNQAGGLIDLQQNNIDITQSGAGANTFTNDGTLEQTNGNNYVEMPLVNNGLVAAENGLLELQGGVLGGTIANQGGNVVLIGTYTSAADTTGSVTFDSAYLGSGGSPDAELTGPGTLISNGFVIVNQYYGNTQLQLTGGITWENAGMVDQTGAILLGNGSLDSATIVNQAGAVFDLNGGGDSQLATNPTGGAYSFVNAGLLEMTGGYTDTLSTSLANTGLVSADSGNFYLSGPVSNSGTIQSDGGFLEAQGGTLGGTFQNLSGNLYLIGTYTVAANTTGTVTFGGAYLGGSGDGAAVLAGSGTLVTDGFVLVNSYYGNTQVELTGGVTWQNAGTVDQTGAILFGAGSLDNAAIVNQAGAVFDLNGGGDSQLSTNATGGTYSFVNAGLLEMTGGYTDTLSASLTNTGLVSADNGNFYLAGPVGNTGTIQSAGGFLEVEGGTLGGTFQNLGGNIYLIGTYAVAANTTGTVTFGGAYLGGSGDGAAVLAGPGLGETGTLTTDGYVYINEYYGNTQLELTGGITWDNAGDVNATGALQFGTGASDGTSATLFNQAGAVFDLNGGGDSQITAAGTGAYSFTNAGMLEMTGGYTDTVSVPLTNTGLVSSQNGNLILAGPIVNTGTIETAGGSVQLDGGVLGGTIDGQNGNAILVGGYTVAANTTTVTFGGAYLGSGGGAIAVLAGPNTLTTDGYVYINEYYGNTQLELTGGITWNNAGAVYDYGGLQFGAIAGDGATIVNQSGATFDLASGNASLTTGATGTYSFVNAGTLEMTGGYTDTVSVALSNSGLVSSDNGTLLLNGPISNSGTIQTAGGAIQIDGGVLGGSILGGNINLLGTYVSAAGTTDSVTFDGAVFGLNGNFAVIAGPGTLLTNGAVTINQNYSDSGLALIGGITWDNAGNVNANGAFQFGTVTGDSATLVNLAGAVFNLSSGNAQVYASGIGAYNFINAGLLEMTGGYTDTISVTLSNSGVVSADNGTLILAGPISNSGTIQTAGGAIQIDGGVLGGSILGGNITLLGTYVSAAGTTDDVTFGGAAFGIGGNFAVVSGPGTLVTNGSFSVTQNYGDTGLALSGGITWLNAGDMNANGAFQFGTIAGDSATLVNQAGAIIDLSSGNAQIQADGTGILVNAGLLEQTGGGTSNIDVAVDDTGIGTITAGNGNLVFNAGATIAGAVNGGNSVSFNGGNVTLAAGGDVTANSVTFNAGTLEMQGGTIASANLSIAGGVDVSGYGALGDLVNNGLIDAAGGLLTVNGNVTGSGSLQIETGATLEITGGVGQNVTFDGVDATLQLDAGSNFTGALEQFGAGDTIDLGGVTLSAASAGSNELIGTLAAGGTVSFSTPNIDAGLQLVLGTDASGASTISLLPSPVSAIPEITTPLGPNNSILLPDAHISAFDIETLTIANTASAPADGLTVGIGAITGDAYATGSITSLAPGASSSNIMVGVDGKTGGAKSSTVTLTFTSDGSVSGVAALLGDPTLNVSGNVYRYADPSVTAPGGVILHVGDDSGTATEALAVANIDPADGFSEGLDAVATGTITGSLISASGSTGDIAAGNSSTALGVAFSTATAGTISGSADVALTSDGSGIDTLGATSLGTFDVPVSVTIDNYATAAVKQSNGPGTLVAAGNTYTIDLGTVANAPGAIIENLDVANTAAGPADWLSGNLSASGSPAFSDNGLGTFGIVSAGATTPLSIDLSTVNAGVFAQTITLAATDSNAAGFNEALAGETIVVTGTVLSTAQLAQPTINEPAVVVLPDAHVASLVENDQTTLRISNTGSAVLSGALISSTGDAYGFGAFSGLGVGGADTTSIVAGLNNTSAGAKSGTVTLNFSSGSAPPVPLGSQNVSLTGNVYREAAPSVTGPANVYVHVGDGGGTETAALTVANTDPADGFSEALDATVLGVVSGGLSSASGTASGVVAGGSNTTALQLTFATATAATIDATVAVKEISDGAGIDSLGLTQFGTVAVPLTVTVDNYATAAIGQTSGPGTLTQAGDTYTLNLGTLIAGSGGVTTDLGLFNTATGPADGLSGALTATGDAAFTNTDIGTVGTLGAGSGDPFEVGLSTANTGSYTETIVFAGTDSNLSGFSQAVAGETLVVTGAVQAPADPVINTPIPIDFGNVRLGTTVDQALSISNAASAGSAYLDVYSGGGSGAATSAGGIILLAPGATDDTDLFAGLNTGTAGVQSGAVYLNIQSDPGPSGTARYFGGGEVDVRGRVYRPAAPSIASSEIAYLHSGGTTSENLTVQNTAVADGYSENLVATVIGVTGALASGSGTVTVAPGVTNVAGLAIAIDAGTTAGIFTGNAVLDLQSDGTGIDGLGILDIGTVDVPVTYDVDNYATAELAQTGGNGLMTPAGITNTYTLNLGATEQNAAALSASLEALNAAQGPAADLLSGTFSLSGNSVFANNGFAAFDGLGFGTADTNPVVTLNTGTIGTYSETIVLSGTGSNPSGYSGVLSNETIDVVGTILPEPPPAPPPLPTAIAWGDVHITTFDGLYYNFQAEGEFVLAQSTVTGDSFQVQARLQPYSANSTVSVITMLAAEVGTDRVAIGLGRTDAVSINGTGVQFGSVGATMSLGGGGSITETSAGSYQVNWATGEVMDVSLAGTYINTSLTLSASDGPGSVQGLLGGDTGQANDFQLADGTVLPQPLDSATLYGAYANAWRVTGGTSLMDYLAGQTTAAFTDTNFPADSVNIDNLPAAILQVAEQEVLQAGITDPNQQAAAIVDLLVTGDPNSLLSDANINQTGVVTDAAIISTPQAPVPALGVSATATNVIETAGGITSVTYTAYLTSAAGTDTVIDYAVTAPDATYLGASAFGGTLPSGYVVIAAGQTTANFTVTLPTAVLGSQPFSNLQVSISSTNGDPVFGPSAQTEIDNYTPVAGNPAIPRLTLSSGAGIFSGSNGDYTLNLGTLVAGQSPLQARFQIGNEALAPSDFLTGTITDSVSAGFTTYGAEQLAPLSAGSSFQGLVIQTNSGAIGPQIETIVFSPVDENVTGYSTILPSQTVTVTDTVLSAAAGTLETSSSINLGTFYQGGVAAAALSIGNVATAGSAGLDVLASVASGAATAGGAITDLAPGATSDSGVSVGIDTSSPGVKTGVVTLSYTSDAGNGNTASDGSTQVQVTGTVYGPATADLSAAPVYVHKGDDGGSVTTAIVIANTAPNNGYAENLDAQVVNFGTYVTAASGSVNRLAPGQSNDTALTATLSDTQLGTYSGEVQVALQSDGTGIDSEGTTSLGFAYVQAAVDVDQYAVAAIEQISGNGTMTPTGVASHYVLDLGTVAQYSTPLGANLGVLNDVLGTSDLLAGSFSVNGAPEFVNAGFTAFGAGTEAAGLSAQQVDGAPVVVLSSGTVGTFSETVTLTPTGYNPSGYSGALTPETVTITGTVVAAPPPTPAARVADAWGDVHLTTFDGLYYNFQAAGEFVLSESTIAGDSFQVQARMQPLGSSSVTLNTEIAAGIGNDRVTFEDGRANVVYIDGVAAGLTSLNEVVTLAGGTLEQQSANSYELIWNTGEQLQVTNEGSYLNATISLPNSDAGNVQGLLGNDGGNPADDLMLPGGTVLAQPTTYAELYGQYADAWRVTDPTSLMDYGPGQDTASFTDTNFPYNQISLGNLPANAVALAEAAAAAAGITDPNLVQAAVEDYLLTGNPNALIGSENVQQQEGTTNTSGTTPTAPPPAVAAIGVFANLPSVVESTSGAEAVGFTISLTSPEANATTVDYQVIDSGPGFLTTADFGGILPSGTVTIAAGQTSALFTVALPANVLGAAADENLQVVIASTGGETVFAPLAETEILATGPTEGNPAAPLVEQLSGDSALSGSGSSYVLNLGTVQQYSDPLIAGLGVLNNGTVPADLLSGSFVVNGPTLYENSGLAPFTPLAAGAADTAPELELLTDQVGTFNETITLSPTDSNLTGFSASLAPVTVVVTGTVTAPPPPPPPPVPVATAWGDVHLTTFDGLYYNFQAAGEFVLTKSTMAGDSFQVQTRLQPYGTGSSVSVQTQLGAKIGTDDVTFGVGSTDAGVYLDGTAYTFNSSGVMTLSGGSVTEISSGGYRVNWDTGESMTVTLDGSYVNDTISLTAADANAVEGLLGPDSGNPSDDLQLADGTVIPQPVTSTELYGAYADAWRVGSDATSLLNYSGGQTTATFTDTSFPADVLQLDQLPASVVAAAELTVEQAGITDPNLIEAAVIDLLVTGNPDAVFASANVQEQGITLAAAGVSSPPPLPDVGVSANSATAIEPTSGTVAVGFTVYLTAAEAQATTITYQVTDPGAGYLGLSGIVGGTGSGSMQLTAGQTSAQITIDVLANALGSQPDSNLQVMVTPTGGESVFGTTAQTEIVNPAPTAGNPAVALLDQLSGNGHLTGSGTSYDLNLGTAQQNASALFANLGIENGAVVPADDLSGLFTITNFANFLNTGFDPFSSIVPGTADTEPVISLNTGTIGVFSETVVLDPTDTNPSGYSAVQSDVTMTVTGTIVAPPPPPPPPVPTATAFGDVHLTTFDGLYYNFQAVGEFTLAKSTVAGDSFDVQIRTEQYGTNSSVSVIDQVAAALGNESVTFGLLSPTRTDMVYLNGTAQALGVGSVLTANGDTVRELSSTSYLVTWSTGETMTVTSGGTYLDVSTALSSSDGPGSVQGLLGADDGTANDFQLADGTVLAQPITTAQLYGAFAGAWRLTQAASLLNYAPGQTTSTFTDLAFPGDALTLADLPSALQQEGLQAAIQAGITDPNLQQAAALDFIVTGNPDIVVGGQNVQQQGITTTAANVTTPVATTAVGVSANSAALVEPGTGDLSVGFTVYLTAAEAQATTIDYTVTAPGAGYLDASAFGGTLPNGSVTIAAGQTSASFSVAVPGSVLGTLPSSALQVSLSPEGGESVFAPDAQTTIVNNAVEPGIAAVPIFTLLGGVGTLTQNGTAYTLNLGSFPLGTSVENLSLALENAAAAGGNSLAGTLSASSTPGFTVSGTGPLPVIAAGSLYEDLQVAVNTAVVGTNAETMTLTPVSQNASGYTSALSPITLTITDSITQQTYYLNRTPTTITGGSGGATIVATGNVLYSGDQIAPNGGSNTLLLQGPGTFDLRAPATLSNIQTADVEDASAGQGQVIYLRNGLDLTLNVQDGANITVVGAANNDVINLGSGATVVTLGGTGETVHGGTGNETFVATAATIGATIAGGTGTNVLEVQGGGSVTMGYNITGVPQILLSNAASYDFTANAAAGLVIHASTGNDTVVVGAGSQSVNGSTGTLIVQATAAESGVAVYGTGGGDSTTLAITTGGTVALNSADKNLTVQLAAADTLALASNTSIAVGGAGDETLIATNGVLHAGQTIAPGGGTNTLLLQGAGSFNLSTPTVLSNIQTVDLEGASAGQSQTVYLRSGLDLTLNVLDGATVTVVGAADNDIINLGTGGAIVYAGTGSDTITIAAASQRVFGSTGTLTVLATAAQAGAAVYGGGVSTSTLEITTGGTVTLNGGDTNLTVQLAAADTLALAASTSIAVLGGGGNDTLIATNGTLRTGQTIAPGGGTNTLLLQDSGTFNLSAPTVLSNIQTVDVTGASAGQSQAITLRNGLDLTLNVQDAASITVTGATNNDIINLGAGAATVTLGGAGETVSGGSGNETFLVTAATIGATIAGGGGTNVLNVLGGGSATMGGNISGVQKVILDNAASYDFTANTTVGLAIHAGTGSDTIAVGGGSQTVFGSTGTLIVQATAAEAGVAIFDDGISNATTLDITTGGTVTLNVADTHLTIQLGAADTLALSGDTSIVVQGGAGDDTLIVTDGVLRSGQTIAPGGTANTLLLEGTGLFNLTAPTVLSNIGTVDVAGASAGQGQLVYLRTGLNLTLDVLDAATVTIFGAANNDIINLGSGNAVVYLGAGETVNGGSGNGTFFVTAATSGATIAGGSGTNVLHMQGGGAVSMGANITGMLTTYLDNSASYDFTANATAGMNVVAGTGSDTIAVGAASQKVIGSSGPLTVLATAAEAGVKVTSGSGAATLEITTGGTATLNASDTSLTVVLNASTNLGLGGLGFITAIGAASGSDTITAGGASQTLESIGGNDTLVGSTKFGDTFLGGSAGLAGDLIKGFGGSDVIDITDMTSGSVQPYVYNPSTDKLTVTDGTHSVTLAFSGSYTAGSFAAPVSDGHGGTLIKFA